MNKYSSLSLLTVFTMIAFAANSLLTRSALLNEQIGPAGFGFIRVASGSVVLFLLIAMSEKHIPRPARPNLIAILSLAAYILGFSFAYVSMDAGIGALILFGGVQITMFAGALLEGERPSGYRWTGMLLAMFGLAMLSLPKGTVSISGLSVLLMAIAAAGWGIYSLAGRKAGNPVAATGWNFIYCVPIVFLARLIWPDASPASVTGLSLAIVSGGITSALGYALWYKLLPSLGATRAALSQLSVPVITLFLGATLLSEPVTWTVIVAATTILGGIAVGLVPRGLGKGSPVRK